jgi:fumarate reductase subunit D
MVQINTKIRILNIKFRFPLGWRDADAGSPESYVYLFIYSLITCNLRVMAML